MDFASLKAKAQQGIKVGEGQLNAARARFNQPKPNDARPPPVTPKPASIASRPPVPPSRASGSAPPAPPARTAALPGAGTFNWQNLDAAEKEAFFGLLDEYFQSRRPSLGALLLEEPARQTGSGPPPLPETFRPQKVDASSAAFSTDYPPPSQQGSSAADFCQHFLRDTSSWHTSSPPQPTFLQGRDDMSWASSSMQMGNTKTLTGAILFSDLSMAVYHLSFPAHAPQQANRQASFSPRPPVLPASDLVAAYETYSEAIAQFAEEAEASGFPVGNGECWTLAAEAIKSLAAYDVPAPVQSINRTHGHLIYEAKATGQGVQQGRWRGGDHAIRRGDIAEFRTVKIKEHNGPPGSWMSLGNPEHTAVVVSQSDCTLATSDGASIPPSAFPPLEVIEQSAGQPPSRRTYDLSELSEGCLWIYRPVSMDRYVGQGLIPKWPPVSPRMQQC